MKYKSKVILVTDDQGNDRPQIVVDPNDLNEMTQDQKQKILDQLAKQTNQE